MGKRIISQRRGKGSHTYRVPNHAFKPNIQYKKQPGVVVDILSDPLRNAPLAAVAYSDNHKGYIVAIEGMRVGDRTDSIVVPLSSLTEGQQISSIETYPNSGPKLCRSPGSFAVVETKTEKECVVILPSKKKMKLNAQCLATLGIPAGDGRNEKPWVKAGKKWIAMHARGKLYPRTSGTSMNAVDHPFGGGYTGLGKPKSVSRNAPPGRKVGSISSRRTGRKNR
ncbi:MAG: 50S ribosomal protein L2 [Candidatus Aenigmarchaeota archaeon]|nr:50S ribosomal protein L2 [Candidatus Aenigmarchaeota archaeon]